MTRNKMVAQLFIREGIAREPWVETCLVQKWIIVSLPPEGAVGARAGGFS